MEQARTDVTLQVNALKIKQRKALPLTISPHLPFLPIDSANCPSPINLRFLLFFHLPMTWIHERNKQTNKGHRQKDMDQGNVILWHLPYLTKKQADKEWSRRFKYSHAHPLLPPHRTQLRPSHTRSPKTAHPSPTDEKIWFGILFNIL